MDSWAVVRELVNAVPEVAPVLDEHLSDHDALLLHLFVADVRDMSEAAWRQGDHELTARILHWFGWSLELGDDDVENAVAVSFAEDSLPERPGNAEYVAAWPESLKAEAARQQAWRDRQAAESGATGVPHIGSALLRAAGEVGGVENLPVPERLDEARAADFLSDDGDESNSETR